MAASPLRLLIVSHSLSGGGAERFAATLLRHLDRSRFAPAACLAKDDRRYGAPAGLRIETLGYRGLASLPGAVRRLRAHLEAERPELVLSNVLSTNCLTGAALAGTSLELPWVARLGNAPGLGEPWYQRLAARRFYPRACRVVANSQGMVAAAAREYPAIASRLEAVPNPTDFAAIDRLAGEPAQLGRRQGRLQLLWLGRLSAQKRPELALEILARLRGKLDAGLWLCGEGPLRPALARRAARLGLGDRLEMPGFVANPFALMREADLLLATSDFEGLPNVLIEAQGLGLPAVATRCPHGPDEIVSEGATGRLYPVRDVASGVEAVLELGRDAERRRAMGEAARSQARERFDLPRVLPRWQSLLLAAAGRSA